MFALNRKISIKKLFEFNKKQRKTFNRRTRKKVFDEFFKRLVVVEVQNGRFKRYLEPF